MMTAATSSAFFQTASPLPKEVFLEAYKDSILLSQLLFAPFGVDADATMRVFGEGIQAQEPTSAVFLLFEDIIAKRLFKLRGFEDDMIVASMHKYISENQDEEVHDDDDDDDDEMAWTYLVLVELDRLIPPIVHSHSHRHRRYCLSHIFH